MSLPTSVLQIHLVTVPRDGVHPTDVRIHPSIGTSGVHPHFLNGLNVTGRVLAFIALGLLVTGCGTDMPTPPPPPQPATGGQGTSLDEATAGVVMGQVVWQGEP